MGWSVACRAEGDRLSVDVFEAKGCEALLKALAGKGIAAVSRLSVFPPFGHTDFSSFGQEAYLAFGRTLCYTCAKDKRTEHD